MDFIFLVGCKKGSMKHVIDLPCFQEAQLIGDGGQDLNNSEGSILFRGEFWVGDGVFEVSGF